MERIVVKTDKAPAAIGPYSQGIRAGNLLFCSGQIPLDPASGAVVGTTIEEQTKRALENLKAVLEAGGSSLSQVVKTTVFLSDMANFLGMGKVYSEYFKENPPARAAFEVSRLPKDALVEIEAVAIAG